MNLAGIPAVADLLDLTHEFGNGLSPDDPLRIGHGLQEAVDYPVVAQLSHSRNRGPADIGCRGAEDLGLDDFLNGLSPAIPAERDHRRVLNAGIGIIELIHEDGVDLVHQTHIPGP